MKPCVPIYLLPGMTPDNRIYQRLIPLLPNAKVISWIEPKTNESVTNYAKRLADIIPTTDCYIGGVSFGGIVAHELSRIVQPNGCFLLSSVRTPKQLPPWMRAGQTIPPYLRELVLNSAGRLATSIPKKVSSNSTMRAAKLAGQNGRWYRWATSAVIGWRPAPALSRVPVFHIHGDRDKTFPIQYANPNVVIHDAGHTLVLTHPTEVAHAMSSARFESEIHS